MWYRAIMLVLGCFVLMTRALAADRVEYGPPPDWVETVALPANDATMAQAPVKSLLLNLPVRFTATGLTFYTQSYLRVLTPQGLSESAKALNPVVERAFQHNVLND